MANWLSAAAQAFQRTPPQPQTFELQCGCGRVTQGVRTANYQQPRCPTCKRQLFVLPFTVYPLPKSRPVSKPKPSPRKEAVDSNRSDIEDLDLETAEQLDQLDRPQPAEASAPPRAKRSKPASAPVPGKALRKSGLSRRPRRPIYTPLRGVFVGIVLVFGLSSWWIVHNRAVQTADVEYLSSSRRARDALADHDLPVASDALETAHRALEISGRVDPPARATQQLYHEIHAAMNLVKSAPGDLLKEAMTTRSTSQDDGWNEVFQYTYRDSWLILDVEVTRVEGSPRTHRYRIDYPISAENSRAVFVADLPIFDKFTELADPQRVIFGAQIDDFRTDPKNLGTWELILKPQSAFLWSNLDTYRLLGLTGDSPDAETRKVLSDQTQLLGLPAWEAPSSTASIGEVPQ